MDAEAIPGGLEHHARRTHRQVLLAGAEIRSVDLERHAGGGTPHDELVGQFQQREGGFDLMKAG